MSAGKSKAKVLVVDDNLQNLRLLRFLLEDDGYEVQAASNGRLALDVLGSNSDPVHLVILDVMMPQMDGFNLCEQIREEGDNTPIIFLSGRGESADRAQGLRLGGDDYLAKPFDPTELLERVAAVLRRTKPSSLATTSQPSLKLGGVELDPARLKAKTVAGREIDLTPTETKLLHCLMRNAGQVLTRDTLINQVWDYDYDGNNNTVDVYSRRLRQKVEPDPDQPRYIRTVRGAGYVFHGD